MRCDAGESQSPTLPSPAASLAGNWTGLTPAFNRAVAADASASVLHGLLEAS